MDADKVQRIRELEEEADKLESELSYPRWEAARLIYEELRSGTSQRALARELHQSQTQICRKAKCWERFARESVRPPFSEAMNSVAPRGEPKVKTEPKAKSEPEDEPKPEADMEVIAKRLSPAGGFRKWLMNQAGAEMTETAEYITLVVYKP